jgi:hypothetical protein
MAPGTARPLLEGMALAALLVDSRITP